MKIEGSIQEVKEFIKEFQPRDMAFSRQQLKQIKEILQAEKSEARKELKQLVEN